MQSVINRIARKIRFSIALKINIQIILRVFFAFLCFNILFIIFFMGNAINKIDNTAKNISVMILDNGIRRDSDIMLLQTSGFDLEYFPKEDYTEGGLPFVLKEIIRGRYIREVAAGDEIIIINRSISPEIEELYVFLRYFVIIELIIILGGIGKGIRAARRLLRPINTLAAMTREINATRFDRRLAISGTQNELKDLAETINQMLDRLEEAYKIQNRFVSDASHELKTPISVIQGYASLLDRWGKFDKDTMQESIEALKSESESMKALVEQLLFLARGDNNTQPVSFSEFSLLEFFAELKKETLLIDKSHKIILMSEDNDIIIEADRKLIKQAMRVLIDNAIKYTQDDGEIRIGFKDEDKKVRLFVSDTGIGIEEKDLPYLFDRFFRADVSRTRKTGGTGLGLTIAKWISDIHKGRIEVVSRLGFGTKISIIIDKKPKEDFIEV